MVPGLTQLGARIVCISGVAEPVIGLSAEIAVRVEVDSEPDPFNMLATSSTLGVIALMDAVAICVMQRNGFDRQRFGMIHPGGAVGERLIGRAPHPAETTTTETEAS